ncbi:hypothetical protein GUJ93_ZPchr0013g36461 [Zizania palustris]|uniref:Uncharacterized protein n=1 Tax=Zizania palustris TaxID=103762 RepID=A0A8J5X209_ZIZPA|nr:hypothetical protein GUJ93_ZPchr0013g36461 [Zizania palustris]
MAQEAAVVEPDVSSGGHVGGPPTIKGNGFRFDGRKKKGLQPMRGLAHTAKASGCGSVHELQGKGSEVVADL